MPRYRDPRDRPRKDVVLDGKAISRRSCVGILCACMEQCLVWNEVSFENRPRHFSRTLRILQEPIATSYQSPRFEINFLSVVSETLGSPDLRRNVSRENIFSAKFLIVLSNLHERKGREQNE